MTAFLSLTCVCTTNIYKIGFKTHLVRWSGSKQSSFDRKMQLTLRDSIDSISVDAVTWKSSAPLNHQPWSFPVCCSELPLLVTGVPVVICSFILLNRVRFQSLMRHTLRDQVWSFRVARDSRPVRGFDTSQRRTNKSCTLTRLSPRSFWNANNLNSKQSL